MKIIEGTEQLFIQDKKSVLDYLQERNMNNEALNKVITNYPFGLLDGAEFIIGSEEYAITHFLSKSETSGYDIESVNRLLNLIETPVVAFAMVAGDDVLCYDTQTSKLFLWLIQTQNGEKIEIEDTLSEFLDGVINN